MIDGTALIDLLRRYSTLRAMHCPTPDEALYWTFTELAEAQQHLTAQHPASRALIEQCAAIAEGVLRLRAGWVRNNPAKNSTVTPESVAALMKDLGNTAIQAAANYPQWYSTATCEVLDTQQFAEELGDVMMMAMVAGDAAGVDPLAALAAKIKRKTGLE